MNIITKIVRALTAWAWKKEINTLDGAVRLKELHATPGGMQLLFTQDPALASYVANAFATIVASAPNYVEMKFELQHPTQEFEWVTVLVRNGNGKTPHELRMLAEEKLKQKETKT